MKKTKNSVLLALAVLTCSCAHAIDIAPRSKELSISGPRVGLSLAYVISDADRALSVTTPAGGGDSVEYYPYRDLEPGLRKVLADGFDRVVALRSLTEAPPPGTEQVDYFLVPKITTTSSSTSFISWPPTDFKVTLDCALHDRSRQQIWSIAAEGISHLDEGAYGKDYALAGRQAAEKALLMLDTQIRAAPWASRNPSTREMQPTTAQEGAAGSAPRAAAADISPSSPPPMAAAPIRESAPMIPKAKPGEGVVAVMPVNSIDAQADKATIMAFEESVRTITGDALSAAGYTILTTETTLAVLSDNGVDAAKACEASCALSAARELKARLFLSVTLTKTEGQYLGFVRLYENARGKQLGALQLEGASVRDLRKTFAEQAAGFFARALDERRP